MPKTTSTDTPLGEHLDRLAAFEPGTLPVLSLYLDMRPDQHGRDNFETFLRKALTQRVRPFKGDARTSFERDAERIREYLSDSVPASANGLALFACAGAGLFEAVQLEAPIEHHWLFVAPVPHLYPLARLNDRYPRYAALLIDTNRARLFVFSLGRREALEDIANARTRRTSGGGWSQARYQRHSENFHLHHMKEAAAALERVVRQEGIDRIVLACDEVARPILTEQLPKHLTERIVDVLTLDINTPEHRVIAETLQSLRVRDAESDAQRVEAMLDAWQTGGLAVAGPEDTLQALVMGQAEEVLIAAHPQELGVGAMPSDSTVVAVDMTTSAPDTGFDAPRVGLAGEIVTRARQNGARVRFIEDRNLLADVGGVGAFLRFQI